MEGRGKKKEGKYEIKHKTDRDRLEVVVKRTIGRRGAA